MGNYLVKGGYKEFEDLVDAKQEPVISEPDIIGGITLDESCRFLLIMSNGFYRSLEEATGTEQVNKYIAQCVVEQVSRILLAMADILSYNRIGTAHLVFNNNRLCVIHNQRSSFFINIIGYFKKIQIQCAN